MSSIGRSAGRLFTSRRPLSSAWALRLWPRRVCAVCAKQASQARWVSTSDSSRPEASKPNISKPGSQSSGIRSTEGLEEYKKYFHYPPPSPQGDLEVGKRFTAHGFLSRRRVKHSKLVFADVRPKTGPAVQVTSSFEDSGSPAAAANKELRSIPLHSPVSVTGTVAKLYAGDAGSGPVDRVDLTLESVQALNPFPKNIVVSDGVQFPATSRHLQIRFSEGLRERLVFRSHVSRQLRSTLDRLDFCEYETPVLFKSTPEGAREFLVPTRRPGLAYALPQSPQQYKQILMASGVGNYYQLARCFRDEDLRADRQPEFTQLDLEMAFARGQDVMATVETLVEDLFRNLSASYSLQQQVGHEFVPCPTASPGAASPWDPQNLSFPRITYEEAMTRYGSDKPDVRIPCEIRRIDSILPRSFVQMITPIPDPAVEAIRLRLDGSAEENWAFVRQFMDSLPASLAANPDGAPAVLMYDTGKPMCGLSSLGHEGFAALTGGGAGLEEFADLDKGDVMIVQAREDKPFGGGSTALGNLRRALYQEAVSKGLLPRDDRFRFLWVHGFPLFSPADADSGDPGQGGQAGFSATHHPFTAPLTDTDLELLATDPLRAKADHYDLVVNGVELGGGSRRIHVAALQEHVLRGVLAMTDEGVARFAHLLDALRAGCPPHAGFALGLDRLVAVLCRTPSVRDVIAFPKSMRGEDLTVKSPGPVTDEQRQTYHLARK